METTEGTRSATERSQALRDLARKQRAQRAAETNELLHILTEGGPEAARSAGAGAAEVNEDRMIKALMNEDEEDVIRDMIAQRKDPGAKTREKGTTKQMLAMLSPEESRRYRNEFAEQVRKFLQGLPEPEAGKEAWEPNEHVVRQEAAVERLRAGRYSDEAEQGEAGAAGGGDAAAEA